MTSRIHSTTVPLKTVRRKNDCIWEVGLLPLTLAPPSNTPSLAVLLSINPSLTSYLSPELPKMHGNDSGFLGGKLTENGGCESCGIWRRAGAEASFVTSSQSSYSLFKIKLNLKNWRKMDLQCCVHFWCRAKSCIYIYTHAFFWIFFSIMVYHRILNTVPCATYRGICCSCFLFNLNISKGPKVYFTWGQNTTVKVILFTLIKT